MMGQRKGKINMQRIVPHLWYDKEAKSKMAYTKSEQQKSCISKQQH